MIKHDHLQHSLFETAKEIPNIKGLTYIPNYITAEQEEEFLATIGKQVWSSELKRRVQHYGYKYDYRARTVDQNLYLGNLPDWLNPVAQKLHTEGYFQRDPDQVIVNEYTAGQGISAHTDVVSAFGDTIASLSLGSGCVMQFSNPSTDVKHDIYLEPRSLIIMSDDVRYKWKHAIPARKTDTINSIKYMRSRRVSLTFRTVIKTALSAMC